MNELTSRKLPLTMKRLVALLVLAVAIVGVDVHSAAAASPTVTKAYRTYWSYDYGITVDSGTVTAGPTVGNPITTGGCTLDWYRNARGKVIVRGAICATPGTVHFVTPNFPACQTPFVIAVNGATVFTDVLGGTCTPQVPSTTVAIASTSTTAGATTITVQTVTFSNPAAVTQTAGIEIPVPSLGVVVTGDGPFTSATATRFAASGPNHYVYYVADVNVSLAPGQTIVVTLTSFT